MKNNFLIFGAPRIEEDEITEVVDCLRNGWLGTGPRVHEFENEFKKYKKSKNAVALNSCTAALHLSLSSIDLKPGDEVITTPLTFCATINSIIHAGGTPVLADIDRKTMNIDPKEIEKKISKNTKCILPVHFAGRPCDMDSIQEICRTNNFYLIEDCAHSIESEYKNKHVGNFGDFGCFSFYVTKNIVTGEGGMLTSNNSKLSKRIKNLALHGMTKDAWKRFSSSGYSHYDIEEPGFKYNMMDLQAAIGIHQLRKIEDFWTIRKELWEYYNESLKDLPIVLPIAPEKNTKHAYHLYTILIDEEKCGYNRDDFMNLLARENIGTGVHYQSITEFRYYQEKYNWHNEDCPNAMYVGRRTLSLPLSARLTISDIDRVVKVIKGAFN